MNRPRIIVMLLLKEDGLVKTVGFNKKRAKYIGDPINSVRIFNDLCADELIFLDIEATKKKTVINSDLVKRIGDEAYMPFAVGGGIKSLDEVDNLLRNGAEKVVINSSIINNIDLVKEISQKYGSQSIIGSIDVKKDIFGKNRIYTHSGTKKVNKKILDVVKLYENAGVGEIMIQSINSDGKMKGYDIDLIKLVSENTSVPVIAVGGSGSFNNMKEALELGKADAIAAGSMFVYHGPRKAVLINYPSKEEIRNKIINKL